jgi:hypothetical protein
MEYLPHEKNEESEGVFLSGLKPSLNISIRSVVSCRVDPTVARIKSKSGSKFPPIKGNDICNNESLPAAEKFSVPVLNLLYADRIEESALSEQRRVVIAV